MRSVALNIHFLADEADNHIIAAPPFNRGRCVMTPFMLAYQRNQRGNSTWLEHELAKTVCRLPRRVENAPKRRPCGEYRPASFDDLDNEHAEPAGGNFDVYNGV